MEFPITGILPFDAGDSPYQTYRNVVSNSLINVKGTLIQSSNGEENFENKEQKSKEERK